MIRRNFGQKESSKMAKLGEQMRCDVEGCKGVLTFNPEAPTPWAEAKAVAPGSEAPNAKQEPGWHCSSQDLKHFRSEVITAHVPAGDILVSELSGSGGAFQIRRSLGDGQSETVSAGVTPRRYAVQEATRIAGEACATAWTAENEGVFRKLWQF